MGATGGDLGGQAGATGTAGGEGAIAGVGAGDAGGAGGVKADGGASGVGESEAAGAALPPMVVQAASAQSWQALPASR